MNSATCVNVEQLVDSPFSLSVEHAHEIFPLLENATGGVRIPLRALAVPLPGAVTQRVRVNFLRQRDATEPGRAHDEIAFDWEAGSRLLPNFHGRLRFRIESSKTRLLLSGEYVPPFGPVGALFDRVVGHRLAFATANDLLLRLARALEARWAQEREQT